MDLKKDNKLNPIKEETGSCRQTQQCFMELSGLHAGGPPALPEKNLYEVPTKNNLLNYNLV